MVDFGSLWRAEQENRRPAPTSDEWDARAQEDAFKYGPSAYSDEFLRLAGLQDGESVFDMGCGAGSLALPCVMAGHEVLAADFSPVMLQRCRESLPPDAPAALETKLLAWEDDWQAAGVQPRSFDVAFASRSIATADLQAAIEKLSQVARRKVCVTVVAGRPPRIDQRLFSDLGLAYDAYNDAAFTFGILTQLGYEPEVQFIRSTRTDHFASREDAQRAYEAMLGYAKPVLEGSALQAAKKLVGEWLTLHLKEDPGAPKPYYVDTPRTFSWAFIAWNVS